MNKHSDHIVSIMFDAIGQINPGEAANMRESFDGLSTNTARALAMATLKRELGVGSFGQKVRCA